MKNAFFPLKIDKGPGFGELSFNLVKKCFVELYDPWNFVCDLSLEKGIFPDGLKIARVNSVLESDDHSKLGNYRPISVLPCFFKIL